MDVALAGSVRRPVDTFLIEIKTLHVEYEAIHGFPERLGRLFENLLVWEESTQRKPELKGQEGGEGQ